MELVIDLNSQSSGKSINEIIKLNVGGHKFTTTMGTLSKQGSSNYFSYLFNGKFQTTKDEEGYIFIDRNGSNFEILLDYLRNGILFIPSNVSLKAVVIEAQFYSISLDDAFLSDIKDGVYADLNSGQRTSIIYLERCKDEV
jgi:hypothetical protein